MFSSRSVQSKCKISFSLMMKDEGDNDTMTCGGSEEVILCRWLRLTEKGKFIMKRC